MLLLVAAHLVIALTGQSEFDPFKTGGSFAVAAAMLAAAGYFAGGVLSVDDRKLARSLSIARFVLVLIAVASIAGFKCAGVFESGPNHFLAGGTVHRGRLRRSGVLDGGGIGYCR